MKVVPHLKRYVLRGFWAAIPLGLSILTLRFLYVAVDQRIVEWIARMTGLRIPGLGFFLVLLTLYLLGLIASNVAGRQALSLVDRVGERIPLVNTVYKVGKQLGDTFSQPEQDVFRKVVLVEFLKPGIWTLGFVTGSIRDRETGEKLLKVYIPTPPNPTSGTLVLVPEANTRNPGWTIDEGLKAVISAGIIAPRELGLEEGSPSTNLQRDSSPDPAKAG